MAQKDFTILQTHLSPILPFTIKKIFLAISKAKSCLFLSLVVSYKKSKEKTEILPQWNGVYIVLIDKKLHWAHREAVSEADESIFNGGISRISPTEMRRHQRDF